MDMRYLMRQAQQMQAKLLETQQNLRVEGSAGGELVKVVLNGAKEPQSVSIAKDAIDPDDPGMLEDLVLAACKDAFAKAEEAMQRATSGMAGGMGLPPGIKP